MKQDTQTKPHNILPDCIIPAVAVGFTVYYLTTITEVPWIAQASAVLVSGLLLLSILAFIVRSVMRIRSGRETVELSGALNGLFGSGSIAATRFALLAMTIAYVWVIDYSGFTLTTFVFVFIGIVLLSSWRNWKNALLVSGSCSIVGYIVFIYFFKTRFPAGPVEIFLKGLL